MANKLVSYLRNRSRAKYKDDFPYATQFAKPMGMDYDAFFRQVHASYLFDWYMEVGCRTGAVFSFARGKTIAVDPYFLATTNVIGSKPALHVFQATSDEFFASNFLEKNGVKLSLSFLDGMHLFEYLLRDFINAERLSNPNGIIAIHDCCPTNHVMTTRALDNLPPGEWTGDVWKLIPILQEYRPDLRITVLNCSSTGLVLVSKLSPDNDALTRNYDAIVKAYVDVDLESYGVERFFSSFAYTDAQRFLDDGAHFFGAIALTPEDALTPVFVTP